MTTNTSTAAKRIALQRICHEIGQRAKEAATRAFAQGGAKILVVDVPRGYSSRGIRRANVPQSEGARIHADLAAYFGKQGFTHDFARQNASDLGFHDYMNFEGMNCIEISLAYDADLNLHSSRTTTSIHLFLTADQDVPDETMMAIMFGIAPGSWRVIDGSSIANHIRSFESDRIGEMEYWLKKHMVQTDPSKLIDCTNIRGKTWWDGADTMLATYAKTDKCDWEQHRKVMKEFLASAV